jgi:hypothetical protein
MKNAFFRFLQFLFFSLISSIALASPIAIAVGSLYFGVWIVLFLVTPIYFAFEYQYKVLEKKDYL